MILDPTQRRFGYGAARLAISRPAGTSGLSAIARQPRAFENTFAALPSLFCVGIAFLLFVSIRIESSSPQPMALIDQTPIEIQLWSEPTPATQTPPMHAEKPQTVAQTTRPQPPTSIQPIEQRPDPTPEPAFDIDSVVMRAPEPITPNIQASSQVVPFDRPIAQASDRALVLPEFPTSAASPPIAFNQNRIESRPNALRPAQMGSAKSTTGLGGWSGSGARHDFLAAHAKMDAASPPSPGSTRPPAVSAAAMARDRATSRVVRRDLERMAYGTGWQEVPLDELPDCSPPGRQDMLKKRILLAAPFERECSHQDGSYRFVETRNLGAFLMWSRTNPDRPTGQPRAKNVCDVLERALRCLDGSPIEESSAQ